MGESGSGKSVTTKAIMRLIPSSFGSIKEGEILFAGKDLTKLSDSEMDQIRGKEISMIFQDPMTSLNPTMTIGKQIMEPLRKHRKLSKVEAKKRRLIFCIWLVYLNRKRALSNTLINFQADKDSEL